MGAGGLASAFVFGDPVAEALDAGRTVAQGPPGPKLKVIVAGGHPGDPEYGCGGTVARLTKLGHEVVLLYLNDGAWPPTGASTRIAEAKRRVRNTQSAAGLRRTNQRPRRGGQCALR